MHWRPPPPSSFRRAHVRLDLKYVGSWRGNDERLVTGRDAEVLPNPFPHRRSDMPPEALRHSTPDGRDHASVDFAAGLSPDSSPDPERSPPVKPCGHRDPCNCSALRARLQILDQGLLPWHPWDVVGAAFTAFTIGDHERPSRPRRRAPC